MTHPLDDDRSLDNLFAAGRLNAQAQTLCHILGLQVSVAELAVFDALDRRGAQSRSGLVHHTGLSRSTISRTLANAESNGHVTLAGSPQVASLTASGRRLLIAERKTARAVSKRLGDLYPGLRLFAGEVLATSNVELSDPTEAAREGAFGCPRLAARAASGAVLVEWEVCVGAKPKRPKLPIEESMRIIEQEVAEHMELLAEIKRQRVATKVALALSDAAALEAAQVARQHANALNRASYRRRRQEARTP